MKKSNLGRIFTVTILLILALVMSKLFTKTSFGADNDEKGLLEGNIGKYINYQLANGEQGTLVQYSLRTGIEYGDGYTAIRNSEINVNLNQIDGKYPYDVKVIAEETKVTNGQTSNVEEDYSYDSNSGNLVIRTNNENEDGEPIYNTKPEDTDRDKFVIVAYYDTYSQEKPERTISIEAKYKANLFTDDNREVSCEGFLTQNVTEDFGDLTSVDTTRSEIYNGYIKSNIINGTTYDTEYTENNEIMISKKEAHQKINITEENTFVNSGDIYYKSTKILKEDFLNILGENGKIEIYDGDNNLLATLDNNNGFNENGEALIVYPEDVNSITIKTSDIINEGFLHIENVKKIKSDVLNINDKDINTKLSIVGINEKEVESEAQTRDTSVLNSESTTEKQIVEEESYRVEKDNTIEVKDSTTNVTLDVDNTNWTNEKQNEVTFDISLNSASVANNLFDTPSIRIKLPIGVEKVILNNSSLMYSNGITMQDPYLETAEDGSIVIVVNLDGKEESYVENNLGLATSIKLSTSIILNNDIETGLGKVSVDYTNRYTLDGSTEQGTVEKSISMENFRETQANASQTTGSEQNTNDVLSTVAEAVEEKAKAEVLAATEDEINSLKITVEPVRGDTELKDGDTVYEGEFIKYNIKIENISSQDIDNVRLVGTIPDGTRYGELSANYFVLEGDYGYKYDNSLKEKEIDVGTVKAGQTVNQFYEVQVKDLAEGETEKEISTNIKAYIGDTESYNYNLNNVVKEAEVKAFLWAGIVGTVNQWNYGVNLYNPTGEAVTIKLTVPKYFKLQEEEDNGYRPILYYAGSYGTQAIYEGGNQSFWSYTIKDNVITITATRSGVYKFAGIIESTEIRQEYDNGRADLTANATITTNDNVEYKTNENRIIYTFENVTVKMTSDNEGEEVEYGEKITYHISITCDSINNLGGVSDDSVYVNIADYLPEHVDPVSITYEYYERIMEEREASDGSTIMVPVGISEKKTKTESIKNTQESENGEKLPNVDIYSYVPYQKTINVTVETTAGYVYEKTEVENSAVVQGDLIKTKTSNVIKHIILPYDSNGGYGPSVPSEPTDPDDPDNPNNPDNPDNPDNPNNPGDTTYSISGISWNDVNGDGNRQDSEFLISGLQVMLVDMADSGNVKATTTTNNGRYTFSNIEQGNYIVVFRYNTQMYLLTQYRASGVPETSNSDAIGQTITLNGDRVNVGVTDTINLTQDANNIDIGLINKNGYDLKLDKYITGVSVTTSSGTKQYSYDNTKLGRVEIRAKEINGAKVSVIYKIVVTNEGEGKVKVNEIYDYLPDGLTFSSSSNANWTADGNTLVNRSLMNQDLNPGESKEITLILTKTMNGEDTGTFTNAAEIGSTSAIEGMNDADSTPGNRNSSEDDYSEAQLIISVSTGLAMYISVGAIILIIVILTILAIKFKIKIKIGKIGKLGILLLLFTVISVVEGRSFAYTTDKDGYYIFPNERFYYWEHGSGHTHTFTGGPTGLAHCNDGSAFIAPGRTKYGCEHDPVFKFSSYEYQYKSYDHTDYNVPALDLQNLNPNDNIGVRKIGDRYILGPFRVQSNYDGGYGFEVYDKVGNALTDYFTCDTNGNYIWVGGTSTFYLSVSSDQMEGGVSRVVVSQERMRSRTRVQEWAGRLKYLYTGKISCSESGFYHQMHISTTSEYYDSVGGEVVIRRLTTTDSVKEHDSVAWTNFNTSLDILKVDKDNKDKAVNIEGTLVKDDGTYNQSFKTTNGKYHFDNLTPGRYILTEKVSNDYGYEAEVNKQLEIYTYSGMEQLVVMTNEKHTGILQIVKKDSGNNNIPLENVGFKLKDSNGQYVIGVDEDGQSLSEASGTIYFGSMKTTTDIAQATEFKTDSKGQIEIYNIRTGTYTVTEVSVGDNNYGFDVDDDYIEWNNGQTSGKGANATIEVTRQRSYDTERNTSIIYDNQKTIPDGTYEVELGANSNFVMEVTGAYTYNSSNVAVYQRNRSLAQQWYVRYLGGGYYRIVNLASNKVLDVNNGVAVTQNGTNVQVYLVHDGTNQQWKIVSTGDGYYNLYPRCNENFVLDVNGATTTNVYNSQNIQTFEINGSIAQKFKFNNLADISKASENTVTFSNKRKYIKLSGKVWEDMISGKDPRRDYKYNATGDDEPNPDRLVANVTVRLKDRNGNYVQFREVENGPLVTETLTSSNKDNYGTYQMVDVLIDELQNYYIEFSYNGMSYTSVPIVDVDLTREADPANKVEAYNGTRAIENTDERTEFNNNYSTITHQGVTDPVGEALDENGQKTYDLNYDENVDADRTSKLNYGPNSVYGYDGQNFPINNTEEQYIITSNTRDAFLSVNQGYTGYLSDIKSPDEIRASGLTEITEINLGLQEREQPDLAIVQDVYTAEIGLNGYNHTYYYDQRTVNTEEFGDGFEEDFGVGVRFENKYGSATYRRTVYSSDIVYNMQEGNEGKLEIYVTYKVRIRNESTNLYSTANEIVNYYDNRYDVDSVYIQDENTSNYVALNYTEDTRYNNNGFKKVTIETNQNIRHQAEKVVYIRYKLQNDAVNSILNGRVTLDSVSEITSYSTYSDENYSVHYGGVDRDSRPGSTIPENKNNNNDDANLETYEDDTDKAPSFILEVSGSEGRVIRGTVWEDNAIQELLDRKGNLENGLLKERKGDGIYVNGENVVSQVKVELLECDDSGNPIGVAATYKKDDVSGNDVEVPETAVANTDSDGNYEISGIIPGKYVIRYTYGDQSIIVKSDGSQENLNPEKYKSTIYRGGDKEAAENMNDYWYRSETSGETNVSRWSDAVDTAGIREDGSRIEDIIEYRTRQSESGTYIEDKTYNYGTSIEEDSPDLQAIESNTRLFDIKMDYDVNLDNISRYGEQLKFVFDNIDLGIIRRPIQNIDVRKEIVYVQVKLSNGQVVAEGDPREGNIEHLRFLPDGNVHVELDSELLQGATLTIRYEIVVDNSDAEIDYNDRDYYIYGEAQNRNSWKLATISSIFDYLSNGLMYDNNNPDNTSNWQQISSTEYTDLFNQGLLSEDALKAIKEYNQILQTSAFDDMRPGEGERRVPLVVSRLLSNNEEDLIFENDIEVNEVINRRMEHDGEYTTPGDYVPSETGRETGYDDDYIYLTVTGPTGEDRNYIPYIILGVSSFIILATGIVFIKKKVL